MKRPRRLEEVLKEKPKYLDAQLNLSFDLITLGERIADIVMQGTPTQQKQLMEIGGALLSGITTFANVCTEIVKAQKAPRARKPRKTGK